VQGTLVQASKPGGERNERDAATETRFKHVGRFPIQRVECVLHAGDLNGLSGVDQRVARDVAEPHRTNQPVVARRDRCLQLAVEIGIPVARTMQSKVDDVDHADAECPEVVLDATP
jgi:hypothetical protein